MSSVPILLYHHIAPDREVTPEAFATQLSALAAAGYRTLSSEELLAHCAGRAPAPASAVVLTFDDGYLDNWVYAYPLLKKSGFRAQLFAVTSRIAAGAARPTSDDGAALPDTRSDERGRDGFLNWSELQAMSASGVFEIGSHTHTHFGFVRGSPIADLDGELSASRSLLEEHLGRPVGQLSWPWGDYDESWLPRAERLGYRLIHTAAPGANRPGGGSLRLRRFKVRAGDPSWLLRRVALYRSTVLAAVYGSLYGLDQAIKQRTSSRVRARP